MPLDRAKLVKLLMMTRSDNDHEALVAMRMANKLLDDAKVSWAGLASVKEVRPSETPSWAKGWKTSGGGVKTTQEEPDHVQEARTMSVREALDFLSEVDLSSEDDNFLRMYRADWKARKDIEGRNHARFFRIVREKMREVGL
jgi:hypothetical protein